jgi:hypothetical protein
MPSTPRQLTLPIHGEFAEHVAGPDWCQRWSHGTHSWLRRSEGGFNSERYQVRPIREDKPVKAYVETHHYSKSYPSALRRFGLYYDEGDSEALVGVAVFGAPMNNKVLSNIHPNLKPNRQSMELNRFVLEGGVLANGEPGGRAPANSESWALARMYEQLAEEGIEGIVAFSDPVARIVAGRTLWPGHQGFIYQASGAVYTGRGTPRTMILLPNGTSLVDRSLQKVRRQEKGHDYVERLLVDLGARRRRGGDPARWLTQALDDVHAVRLRHRGNHRYVMWTSKAARRRGRGHLVALPYPKPTR